eukprot:TRINITY_DN27078_c0_g1_i2.p1 TRINITY_DN27078_c0_g1~~TRINITY_DN27078_c0_g1_i2.p1  ORF type:complete len:399 (-),score=58.98 TRINITY_DN27078_c0_g1_i2:254-1450(-)
MASVTETNDWRSDHFSPQFWQLADIQIRTEGEILLAHGQMLSSCSEIICKELKQQVGIDDKEQKKLQDISHLFTGFSKAVVLEFQKYCYLRDMNLGKQKVCAGIVGLAEKLGAPKIAEIGLKELEKTTENVLFDGSVNDDDNIVSLLEQARQVKSQKLIDHYSSVAVKRLSDMFTNDIFSKLDISVQKDIMRMAAQNWMSVESDFDKWSSLNISNIPQLLKILMESADKVKDRKHQSLLSNMIDVLSNKLSDYSEVECATLTQEDLVDLCIFIDACEGSADSSFTNSKLKAEYVFHQEVKKGGHSMDHLHSMIEGKLPTRSVSRMFMYGAKVDMDSGSFNDYVQKLQLQGEVFPKEVISRIQKKKQGLKSLAKSKLKAKSTMMKRVDSKGTFKNQNHS